MANITLHRGPGVKNLREILPIISLYLIKTKIFYIIRTILYFIKISKRLNPPKNIRGCLWTRRAAIW